MQSSYQVSSTGAPSFYPDASSLQLPSVLTSFDGQPYSYPAPVYVQNTFVQMATRTASFDEFFQERQIRSSPANCLAQAGAMKTYAPEPHAVPASSLIMTADSSMVSSAASLAEFSSDLYEDHHPANNSGNGYILVVASPEYGTHGTHQRSLSDTCQQQFVQVPSGQFVVAPDNCTQMPGHMSAGFPAQPNLDYSPQTPPPQEEMHFHDQHMHMSTPMNPGMQNMGDIGLNAHFNFNDQITRNHTGFREYRSPLEQPQGDYACPSPQQPVYESYSSDQFSFAMPPGQMSSPSAVHVMHAMAPVQTGSPYQLNTPADFQSQGPQMVDANGIPIPRMVLQLNVAIDEQQRQLQQQQMQQQQLQQQAAFMPPPAPPSAPAFSSQSVAPAPAFDDQLMSRGSEMHNQGRCKPCAFLYTKGCGNGADCPFCHICAPGEKKKRRKEKVETRKGMRQLRQAMEGSLNGWWQGMRGNRHQEE